MKNVADVVTDYPKADEIATKRDLAELEARIAGKFVELHRMIWLQGIGIVGIMVALNFFGS